MTFQNTCTDRHVLIMAIRARCDIRAEDPDYSTIIVFERQLIANTFYGGIKS